MDGQSNQDLQLSQLASPFFFLKGTSDFAFLQVSTAYVQCNASSMCNHQMQYLQAASLKKGTGKMKRTIYIYIYIYCTARVDFQIS